MLHLNRFQGQAQPPAPLFLPNMWGEARPEIITADADFEEIGVGPRQLHEIYCFMLIADPFFGPKVMFLASKWAV